MLKSVNQIIRNFSKSQVKVVLVRDQANLGVEGEVVKVKPGYANNYLIPNHVAVYDFPGVQKRLYPSLTEYDIMERKQAMQKEKLEKKKQLQQQKKEEQLLQ